ncbi:cell adhesion molecule CEACAM6-like isoform X2 [Halichoerus grypus]
MLLSVSGEEALPPEGGTDRAAGTMEPPSAPPRGGRFPWQEVLLAVSLLTFWNPPTTVKSVPPNVAEGKDVLLLVHNLPGDPIGYGWFRGQTVEPSSQIVSYAVDTQVTTPGLAHSGRETIYPNGSLLFQNITLKDTGYYTIQIIKRNVQVDQVTGQLRVFPELPKPNIASNNSNPVENVDSVVLTCEPQTQSTSYLWSVNNKSLPASTRLQLSLDNRILTIHNVTRNDTGPYECATRNPVSAGRSDPFTLNVLCLDHSDNLSNKIEEVAYSSLNFNAQEPKKSTSASPSPAATETVYAEVQKK